MSLVIATEGRCNRERLPFESWSFFFGAMIYFFLRFFFVFFKFSTTCRNNSFWMHIICLARAMNYNHNFKCVVVVFSRIVSIFTKKSVEIDCKHTIFHFDWLVTLFQSKRSLIFVFFFFFKFYHDCSIKFQQIPTITNSLAVILIFFFLIQLPITIYLQFIKYKIHEIVQLQKINLMQFLLIQSKHNLINFFE